MRTEPGAVLAALALALALGGIAWYWRASRLRHQALGRLEELLAEEEQEERLAPPPFVRVYWLTPWVVALAVILGLWLLAGVPVIFALTFGLLTGLLGRQVEGIRVGLVTQWIEEQLADAVDLMVGALRAGAGTLSALDSAAAEASAPLRPQLEEVLGRIRYGDDVRQVLRDLQERVPLEPFRLFSSALAVHQETGGNLAPSLATVGRVIRDRIEVSRRVRTLTTQTRVSILGVTAITYFLAAVMWRNDPARMEAFLSTTAGELLTAGALLLQAVGILWCTYLSRTRY